MTLVSSCRPLRATKTRLGSLIQISSTSGSSRNRCSGPKPETRATSSPITPTGSGTGVTTPVRLRSSWARTTSSAIRRTRVDVELRVDPFAAYDGTHLLVEVSDQIDRGSSRDIHGHEAVLPLNYETETTQFRVCGQVRPTRLRGNVSTFPTLPMAAETVMEPFLVRLRCLADK